MEMAAVKLKITTEQISHCLLRAPPNVLLLDPRIEPMMMMWKLNHRLLVHVNTAVFRRFSSCIDFSKTRVGDIMLKFCPRHRGNSALSSQICRRDTVGFASVGIFTSEQMLRPHIIVLFANIFCPAYQMVCLLPMLLRRARSNTSCNSEFDHGGSQSWSTASCSSFFLFCNSGFGRCRSESWFCNLAACLCPSAST